MSKKLCILWLFIAMVAFSSCSNDDNIVDVSKHDEIGEADVPKDGESNKNDRIISSLRFIRCDYWIGQSGLPYLGQFQTKIDECAVGDNVVIAGTIIYYSLWTFNDHCNHSIIAKTTSSKTVMYNL